MPKNGNFGEFMNNQNLRSTVLPDRSLLIRQKLVENAKIVKFKCNIFESFSNMCNEMRSFWTIFVHCVRTKKRYSYYNPINSKGGIDPKLKSPKNGWV